MANEGAFADGLTPSRQGAIPAAPIQRAYDLHGCTLGVFCGEGATATFLDSILASLACDLPGTCDWMLSVAPVNAIEIPSDGSRVFEGALSEGLPAVIVEYESRRCLITAGHFAISLNFATRTAELSYVNDRAGAMGGTASFWMLANILAAHSQYLLHGAAVVDPRVGEVVALFAPSGIGKTTTALALARSGFHFAADDALVLSVRQHVPYIWGIHRRLKISQHTASMLAWLMPCLTEDWIDGEQTVGRDMLAPFVTLATSKPRRVGRVIVLMPPNDHDHILSPMAKPHALSDIAYDNVRVAPGGVEPDKAAAFAALSTLIATADVVALSPGPDPSTLARRIFEL